MEFSPTLTSLGIAFGFVGVLYMVPKRVRDLPREHPAHIEARMIAVGAYCGVLAVAIRGGWLLSGTALGVTPKGALWAVLKGVFPTAVLYFGPIVQGGWIPSRQEIRDAWSDVGTWRNLVVAPFAEEFVFRAVMMSLYAASGASVARQILMPPFVFAVSHIHHVWERRREGYSWTQSLVSTAVQLTYTGLFGAFAGFLYVRTGHLAAPLASHVFCNYFGLPNVGHVFEARGQRKTMLVLSYVVGLVGFMALLLVM